MIVLKKDLILATYIIERLMVVGNFMNISEIMQNKDWDGLWSLVVIVMNG